MTFLNNEIDYKEILSSLKIDGAWVGNNLIKKEYINKLLLDFPNTLNFNDNNKINIGNIYEPRGNKRIQSR